MGNGCTASWKCGQIWFQQAAFVLYYPYSVKRRELLHCKLERWENLSSIGHSCSILPLQCKERGTAALQVERWKDLSSTGRCCPILPLQCKESGTAALQVEKVERFECNRPLLSYTTPLVKREGNCCTSSWKGGKIWVQQASFVLYYPSSVNRCRIFSTLLKKSWLARLRQSLGKMVLNHQYYLVKYC